MTVPNSTVHATDASNTKGASADVAPFDYYSEDESGHEQCDPKGDGDIEGSSDERSKTANAEQPTKHGTERRKDQVNDGTDTSREEPPSNKEDVGIVDDDRSTNNDKQVRKEGVTMSDRSQGRAAPSTLAATPTGRTQQTTAATTGRSGGTSGAGTSTNVTGRGGTVM